MKQITQFFLEGESLTLKSIKKNTLPDGLIQRTSSMLDEIESKVVREDKECD